MFLPGYCRTILRAMHSESTGSLDSSQCSSWRCALPSAAPKAGELRSSTVQRPKAASRGALMHCPSLIFVTRLGNAFIDSGLTITMEMHFIASKADYDIRNRTTTLWAHLSMPNAAP